MKKPSKIITLSAAVALAFSLAGQDFASAAAFKDLDSVQDKDKIIALYDSGLIKGITAEQFAPNKTVTQAESVQFFVNALGLNLDFIRFVKESQASDYYKHANDSAWYAKAFIIAAVNGLDLPADLYPNEKMTREAFTHQLVHAIEIAGKLPLIKPIVQEFKDQDQVKIEYSGSIQRALNYGVVSLDQDGRFQPKKEISRAEAAIEMSNALHYLKTHSGLTGSESLALTAEQAVQLIKGATGENLQIKVDPKATVTRESFTYLLVHTLQSSGQLPMLNLVPAEIKDNDNIDILNQGAIQTALALGFVQLDPEGHFNPKAEITRTDATDMVVKAVKYLNTHPVPEQGGASKSIKAEQAVELIKKAAGNTKLQIKINAEADVTRESFTYLLIHTLQAEGKLPMLNIVLKEIKDNGQIDIQYQGAIQTALALKIVELDAEGNFHPKNGVTLEDATAMIERVQKLSK
ncbi:S-layer homology domain-containing protein [Paenibacillus chibensis]|uniref:S-layer homology domain-containing protein n=1 Tax=Paenibacillus chibensis TaxID=59846 RepID=A0ABU6PNL9_9BACL|nr:S-layer homology domain-containing protein [Paenibacillus chibensis]